MVANYERKRLTMYLSEDYISYSIVVFIIVLLAGCILNLLKRHYIFQLSGIAFQFTYMAFKSVRILVENPNEMPVKLYIFFLPTLMGISACLVSMVLGFWMFPYVRMRLRDK